MSCAAYEIKKRSEFVVNPDKPVGDRSRYVVLELKPRRGKSHSRGRSLVMSKSASEGYVRTRTGRRTPLCQGSRRSRPMASIRSSTNITTANPAHSP